MRFGSKGRLFGRPFYHQPPSQSNAMFLPRRMLMKKSVVEEFETTVNAPRADPPGPSARRRATSASRTARSTR